MKNQLILAVFLALGAFAFAGCGLAGKKGVPMEQINADLANKTVKFNEGKNQWFTDDKKERCFSVNDGESKISDTNADLSVTFSSWYQDDLTSIFFSVNGKMLLHYKNEGGKWVLQSIEPKDANWQSFTGKEELKKFLDTHVPVCKGFRHTSY